MNEEIRNAWDTLIRSKINQILIGYWIDLKIEEESMSLSISGKNSECYAFEFKEYRYDEEKLAKIMVLLCGGTPPWGWSGGGVFYSIESILEGVENERAN